MQSKDYTKMALQDVANLQGVKSIRATVTVKAQCGCGWQGSIEDGVRHCEEKRHALTVHGEIRPNKVDKPTK